MNNIIYKDLHDTLIDRMGNQYSLGGQAGEFLRQKKSSDVVIARSATKGMIELCRSINHVSIPDLVETVTLTGTTVESGISAYNFPDKTLTERESDQGLISIVINDVQVPMDRSESYEEMSATIHSKMYGGYPSFNINPGKRRVYTKSNCTVKAIIVKKPHSIYAPTQEKFPGGTLEMTVDGGADGTVTFEDGIGGSVDISVLSGDSISDVHDKIVTAINADTGIAYDSFVDTDAGKVQLYHRYTIDVDVTLEPSISAGGTGTYVLTDTGTYEIPIPYHYFDDVVRLSLAYLLDSPIQEQQDEE